VLCIEDSSEPRELQLNPNQHLQLYGNATRFLKYLNCQNITELKICDGIEKSTTIEDLHLCISLTSLCIGHCNDEILLSVAPYTQIKKLDLFKYPKIKLNYLERLTFLQKLTIHGSTNINELMEKLRFFTQLTYLHICGNFLCGLCFRKFEEDIEESENDNDHE